MDIQTATLFFALLALLAQAAVAMAVILTVGSRLSPALASTGRAVVEAVRPQAFALATAVAATCTAGSLYLSEVAHFRPCHLCWIQRGFMYPLVLVGLLAVITRHGLLRWLGTAMAAVGAAVSSYHMFIERFPEAEASGVCDISNPCSAILVERAGYVTIPTMALSGFALIITLFLIARPKAKLETQ